jgi:hypothetical protein
MNAMRNMPMWFKFNVVMVLLVGLFAGLYAVYSHEQKSKRTTACYFIRHFLSARQEAQAIKAPWGQYYWRVYRSPCEGCSEALYEDEVRGLGLIEFIDQASAWDFIGQYHLTACK